MSLRLPLLLSAALLALAGCAGSDPGSGSKTLFVDAVAQSDGSFNGTTFVVTVRQSANNGDYINDAQVTVISDKGTEYLLPWVGIFGIGSYAKSGIAWEPGWRLRIVRGTDKLEGYVLAPGLTTITQPTAAAPFERSKGQPLLVQWRDEGGRTAETVQVRLSRAGYDQIRAEDRGSFEIPVGTWSQAYSDERLRVIRTTDTILAGGVDGSTFKAITTAEVRFAVQ
ncbi:MAG TPA: hypothetical protein VK447_16790 [Myxococcaceae bacterium]|nr:hypothetical protein [Myxococcaceae bacterium]